MFNNNDNFLIFLYFRIQVVSRCVIFIDFNICVKTVERIFVLLGVISLK